MVSLLSWVDHGARSTCVGNPRTELADRGTQRGIISLRCIPASGSRTRDALLMIECAGEMPQELTEDLYGPGD